MDKVSNLQTKENKVFVLGIGGKVQHKKDTKNEG
jgi:hypothetical protein